MRVPRSLIPIVVLLVAGSSCAREKQRESGGVPAPASDSTAAASAPAPGVDTSTVVSGENPLIGALRTEFQKKNPKLTRVGVLDLDAWFFKGPRLVLAWGIVGDYTFRGDFNDEMFGVFVVDESLTHIERVVDIFPTRAWYDYHVRFGRLTGDSVEVLGRGDTYGDDPTLRAYKWAGTSP